MTKKFKSKVDCFENNPLWNFHIPVPNDIALFYKEKGIKRFICTVNGDEKMHAAINSSGNDTYFLFLNATRRKRLKLTNGDLVSVQLVPDESKYGMPLPVEFEEAFEVEEEAKHYFEKLTPGKQRSLIYIVDKIKSLEKRAHKTIVICEHLKRYKGALDYKVLNQAFKEANQR